MAKALDKHGSEIKPGDAVRVVGIVEEVCDGDLVMVDVPAWQSASGCEVIQADDDEPITAEWLQGELGMAPGKSKCFGKLRLEHHTYPDSRGLCIWLNGRSIGTGGTNSLPTRGQLRRLVRALS